MSKLMSMLGTVLMVAGALLALMGIFNPAQMNVYGLTMETAAIMLTGGVLSLGLGGVIAALLEAPAMKPQIAAAEEPAVETVLKKDDPSSAIERPKAPEPAVDKPSVTDIAARVRFNPFARKTETADAATAVAAGQATAAAEKPPMKSAVDDTIAALEKAKADIANAIGGVDRMASPPDADEPAEDDRENATMAADETEEAELYVIEEREIRGRPARILSDNTVEAETDEGWMRFENLEHLNEYLDAMGEPA